MRDSETCSGCWYVSADQAGKALSGTLRALFPNQSWGSIKRLIENRHVAVNGLLSLDAGRRLVAGDEIVVHRHSMPVPLNAQDIEIQFIDDSLLVVEKPAGMISLRHSAQMDWPAKRRLREPTLDEAILERISEQFGGKVNLASLNSGERRKHLRSVHRLDRNTSGLLVFARTGPMQEALIRQFEKHSVDRIYEAIVFGHPEPGTIRSRLVRDRGDGLRGSTSSETEGKLAVTHVRTVELMGGYSHIECQLETGRTHQIRIHLAEAGTPVCGDDVYRSGFAMEPVPDESGSGRLALHAGILAFHHPVTRQRLEFRMPLPPDLATLKERLRSSESQP